MKKKTTMMVNMAIEIETLKIAKMDFSSYIGLILVALVFLIRMLTSKKLPAKKAPSYSKPPVKREPPNQSPKSLYDTSREPPPLINQVKVVPLTFAQGIAEYKSASGAYHHKKKQVPRIQKVVNRVGSKKNLI